MFFGMVSKKLFSLQNVMKKLFETHYSLEKNCLQVPKMVTPDKKIMVRPLYRELNDCLSIIDTCYSAV